MRDPNQSPYTADEVQVISGTESLLKRPSMYWGSSNPTTEDAVSAVVGQLAELGCAPTLAVEFSGWQFVGSPVDWFAAGTTLEHAVRVFQGDWSGQVVSLNSVRVEYLLTVFAENLVLWRNNEATVLKGTCSSSELAIFGSRFSGCTAIAFSGNEYDKRRKLCESAV